jgi:hypothetical protein
VSDIVVIATWSGFGVPIDNADAPVQLLARGADRLFRAPSVVRSMTSSKTIRQERIFSECANEVAAVLK